MSLRAWPGGERRGSEGRLPTARLTGPERGLHFIWGGKGSCQQVEGCSLGGMSARLASTGTNYNITIVPPP